MKGWSLIQRALISIDQFEDLGGAELVVLELIEWLVSHGWMVALHTRCLGPPLQEELSALLTSNQLKIHLNSEEKLSPADFDLLWITHSLVPLAFLHSIAIGEELPPTVWMHMGSLDQREAVVFAEIETALASKVLVVSERTKEKISHGGVPSDKIVIFDNPVPTSFLERERPTISEAPRRVLCVSNHIPDEVAQTLTLLTQSGVSSFHLGRGGDLCERITPELLSEFDAVITIGKTTQYCLVMGIPVYSYDHFGGVGWLHEGNYKDEAAHNFSGYRLKRQISATEIADEILDGYHRAATWATQNRQAFARHYSLERQLVSLLRNLPKTGTLVTVSPEAIANARAAVKTRWA